LKNVGHIFKCDRAVASNVVHLSTDTSLQGT
jgi:hypothetical protein